MKWKWIIVFISSLTFLGNAYGQGSFLYLKKIGSKRSIRFYKGENIKLKLREETHFVSGEIQSLGKDTLTLLNTKVPISDIELVYIRNKNVSWFSFRSSPSKLLTAGILLPAVDALNQSINDNRNVNIGRGIWITSVVLVGYSFLLKAIEPRYFQVDQKHKITIIDKS